ncbi:MAG TPA: PEPxxWA-CTERM sorting domain-containing protein [Sphingomicrobium sp.]|nr:PEPxxWA-CTERM sorting domain-containing protein [Sphingomicrobium sp.]
MRMSAYVRPIAATLMLALFQAAHAGTTADPAAIPGGNQQLDYFGGSSLQIAPTHVGTADLSAPISYSSPAVSVISNPLGEPTVSASASAGIGDTVATGRAALSYFIYVSGPDPALSVPIFFSSNLSVTAGGTDGAPNGNGNEGSLASAEFYLQEYNASPTVSNSYVGEIYDKSVYAQTRFNNPGYSNDLSLFDSVTIPTGFYLGAVITADVSTQDGGIASASADPYFSIDPAFLAAHPGYTLSFSPFVGNDAPSPGGVPEPATWAMMLIGFGGIGFTMRGQTKAIFTQPV